MIRTIVIPQNTDIHLSVPKDYIGRQIEVLLYATDEVQTEEKKINNAARFKGLLTKQEAEKYHQYVNKSRLEWDRGI